MPIHNWTPVNAGVFHHFHHGWITSICNALNSGILPAGYYALAEQVAGNTGPDVLAIELNSTSSNLDAPALDLREQGAIAVEVCPPQVQFVASTEIEYYLHKQQMIVIHHSSDDRVVALIEIISPGNKSSSHAFRKFLDKAAAAVWQGYHLLIIDLFPPTSRDPQGIHGAIWNEICDDSYRAPANKPLTLAAYSVGETIRAYVEPIDHGAELPEMPLFLEPGSYVNISLETTYQTAWKNVPSRWREVVDPT